MSRDLRHASRIIPLFLADEKNYSDKAPLFRTATAKISSVPGVTVAPAVCDGSGLVANGGNTVLGGDGSGVSNNGDKQVAPNTNSDGSDNPAGRQANRRVEIFIPAF